VQAPRSSLAFSAEGVVDGARPDPQRFRILAVVWCAYLMVYLVRLSVGPLSPFLRDSFDLSNAQIGGLISATALTYAPTLIVAGWLADKVGVRRVLIGGSAIAAVCVLAMFWAPSYPALLVLLALSSIGAGCIYPSAVRAVMLWFPARERATAVGINQAAINVSGMLGAATLPALAAAAGWRAGFLAMGVLGVVVTGVVVVGYRDPRHDAGEGSAPVAAPDDRQTDHGWAVTRRLLRSRDVWLLMLFGLFLGVVEYSALTQLVLYLKDVYLLGAVAAGGMLVLCQAAGALGKPLSGLASDRLFNGRRRPGLLVLTALTLLCCLVLALFSSGLGWVLYAMVALLGLGAVGWGGLFGTLAGEIGGRAAAGQVAGFTAAGVNVGVLFGPPLFGLIVDRSGSYGTAWAMLAVASVVAAGCVALVREPRDVALAEAAATLADT